MPDKYGGDDRREFSRDHDLLLELKGILLEQNAVMAAQKEALGSHIRSFEKHVQDDGNNFISIWKMINSLRWYVAMGTGVIVALEFASKYILK